MKLNRTGAIWNRDERNKINDNWDKLERNTNDFQGEITDKVFAEIKDSAKLNWESPVNNFSALPNVAKNGETRFTRDTGKVYRFDGKAWKEIQEIDAGPVNELDSRLKTMLAETDNEIFKSSLVSHKVKGFNVWWIDDDGHKGVYTKLAPILREYGIKMSSAVITNRPHGFPIAGLPSHSPNSSFMSYNQMKELEEEGIVEFIPHSHTHDLNHRYTDMTVDEIHDDMSQCKSIMQQLGWNYKDLVFPFGAHNAQVREVARRYFRSGIDIKGGAFIPPVNQLMLPRQGMDTTDTQDIINEINKAYENDTLIILMSHVDQYGGLEESKMRAVIEHVQSLGGNFITGEEAICNYGNLLQVGGDSISYDGEFHGSRLGITSLSNFDEFMNKTPQSAYKKGVTISGIRFNNRAGLPGNRPGVVLTVKPDESEAMWTRQYFYEYNGEITGERYALTASTWSEWKITNVGFYGLDKYTNTSKPSEFPMGLSINGVRGDQSIGLPYNMPGTLETQKIHSSENGWSRQIFKAHSDNLIATRHGNSSGDSWGPWEIVGEYIAKREKFNGDNKPSDFIVGTTMNIVRYGRGIDLPTNNGCVFKTTRYNVSEIVYTTQEVREMFGNKTFTRTAKSASEWNDWKQLATV